MESGQQVLEESLATSEGNGTMEHLQMKLEPFRDTGGSTGREGGLVSGVLRCWARE